MRLPPFLEFLRPRFQGRDRYCLQGHILVERFAPGQPSRVVHDGKNYIVDQGITAARDLLLGPASGTSTNGIFRMAVGNGGSVLGSPLTPKLPDETWPARTGLYGEVLRQDISSFETPSSAAARFVGIFNSTGIATASFGGDDEVINEAALITGDGVLSVDKDPKEIRNGDVEDGDEKMFSTRTFKSAPFAPSEDVTIQITWTITVSI